MEARAAIISTGLVGDDLNPDSERGVGVTSRRRERGRNLTAAQREAYHDIFDKGDTRDGSLYGKKVVWLAWF